MLSHCLEEWYFTRPASTERLRAAAMLWLGTPFARGMAVRGQGVDCVHLPYALFTEACNIDYKLETDPRKVRQSHPQADSVLLAALEDEPRLASFSPRVQPCFGDLAVFGLGYLPHHLAVVLDPPNFIHVMRDRGVCLSRLNQPSFSGRLHRLFRLRAGADRCPAPSGA